MARRSLRVASASSTPTSTKRAASSKDIPLRPSKRARSQTPKKETPTKSRYFKKPVSKDETASELSSESESADNSEESGYDEQEEDVVDTESEPEDETEMSEEEPKRKGRGKGAQARKVGNGKKAELWRPGAKTGHEPGTEVLIKKPKARDAGKTPYKDNTIHPNTMLFLKDLAENNDRQWLKMHDPDFRQSENDFKSFVECLTQKLIEADETVPELPVKDIVFRIYRDVRFSKDQTPYKAHFSAAWSRTGRKGPYAAYYVQIKPGGNFVGGGLWHPEAPAVAKLRRNIDRHPERIKTVLMDTQIRKEFLSGAPKDEKKVVKAFVETNKESALKTKPKGFESDHKDIALLRLKNFTIGRRLGDTEVVGAKGLGRISEVLSALVPFISHLNSVVMPDEDESSESESESEE